MDPEPLTISELVLLLTTEGEEASEETVTREIPSLKASGFIRSC